MSKNCCSFSDAFAVQLGVGRIPAWVHRLADAGKALGLLQNADRNDDFTDISLEHVMATRLQRRFRERQAARMPPSVAPPPPPPAKRFGIGMFQCCGP